MLEAKWYWERKQCEVCEIRVTQLVETFCQLLLGIFEACLSALSPRNKEGWKEEKARVGSKAANIMSSAFRLWAAFVLPCSSASLSSDPGLIFVSFCLFNMEGPCLHKSYIWKQMGTCVYAYFPLRFVCLFNTLEKQDKEQYHSKNLASLSLLCQRGSICVAPWGGCCSCLQPCKYGHLQCMKGVILL